ncbi:MAG: hypothetical protein ACT4PG_12710 [Panacagrimonas sp.]
MAKASAAALYAAAGDAGAGEVLLGYSEAATGVSLRLLRQIARTVDSLCEDEREIRGLVQMARGMTGVLRNISKSETFADWAYPIEDRLERALEGFRKAIPVVLRAKNSIEADERLSESHTDLLHTSYESYVDELARLEAALTGLLDSMIALDLRSDSRGGPVYKDSKSLIASFSNCA